MKIAHYGNFCPHSNGMFFTIKDLILGEREAGIDAQFIDWGGKREYEQQISRVGLTYEGITSMSPDWGINEADILVLHSAVPKDAIATGKPIVSTAHGRPEYSFELERMKKGSSLALYHQHAKNPQVKAFVTFWKEHVAQWELIVEKPYHFVPAMVDLKKYNPNKKKYEFKGHGEGPHVVIDDIWREDQTPFNVVMAAALFIKKYAPKGKLHIFGMSDAKNSAFVNFLNPLKKQGIIGEMHGLIKYMDDVYRGADMFVTPHVIATRTVREALACGCPIVAGQGNQYTEFTANQMDVGGFAEEINRCWKKIQCEPNVAGTGNFHRNEARKMAEKNFNPRLAGEAIKPIFEKIIKDEKNKPKPELKCKALVKTPKFRIHNFVPYAAGYEGKNIGIAYNKSMAMIPDGDWGLFIDHDAMFTTSEWYHQLYAILEKHPEYSCFGAITNRIGNPDQMFAGVDKENHDIMYHREIGQRAYNQMLTNVKDVTNGHAISGVVILVSKEAWKKAGGFKEEGFLGVDNDFHFRLKKAGLKVGIMKGVYVYHTYRAGKHPELQPVGGI